jgi:hypothetical protein
VDWAKAIEINQAALARIVAALFAMLGLAEGGVLERPPRVIYLAVLRILRPAESALRRLIIMAARGLRLDPAAPSRPMPQGLAVAGKGGGRVSFQLFDSRKRFVFAAPRKRPATVFPRIWNLDDPHLAPYQIWQREISPPAPEPKPDTSHLRLGRRLAAIKAALDDLPRQAMRLLRWQARRNAMPSPKFTFPLRPGAPPGHRKEPVEDVDFVLKECHALARDALSANTS